MKPDNAMFDSLVVFPFITHTMVNEVKAELPTHVAKAVDISSDVDSLE